MNNIYTKTASKNNIFYNTHWNVSSGDYISGMPDYSEAAKEVGKAEKNQVIMPDRTVGFPLSALLILVLSFAASLK